MTLGNTRARLEREALVAHLEDHRGDIPAAAAALGISRSTLCRRMATYGIARTIVPVRRFKPAARPARAVRFRRTGPWTWEPVATT